MLIEYINSIAFIFLARIVYRDFLEVFLNSSVVINVKKRVYAAYSEQYYLLKF